MFMFDKNIARSVYRLFTLLGNHSLRIYRLSKQREMFINVVRMI